MPGTNFHSSYPRRLYIKFGIDWSSGFGEDIWALWTTTTDGHRSMGILFLRLRWAKNQRDIPSFCRALVSSDVHSSYPSGLGGRCDRGYGNVLGRFMFDRLFVLRFVRVCAPDLDIHVVVVFLYLVFSLEKMLSRFRHTIIVAYSNIIYKIQAIRRLHKNKRNMTKFESVTQIQLQEWHVFFINNKRVLNIIWYVPRQR